MEKVVYHSPSLRILDYQCSVHCCGKGPEEESDAYQVVLPRAGLFIRHFREHTIVGDSNSALFFNAGETYRVSHPVGGGDRCTVLIFPVEQIQECLMQMDPESLECGPRLFSRTHVSTAPVLDILHRKLFRVAKVDAEPVAVEETADNVLSSLICAAESSRARKKSRRQRSRTMRRHDDIVVAVCEYLMNNIGTRLNLEDIARQVHVSRFHLCRLFQQHTGIPLSTYHRRLRLRAALQRILDGEADLTRLALDVGFSNHSHFTCAFRKEFGIVPSANRNLPSLADIRAMCSDMLVSNLDSKIAMFR